MSFKLQTFRPFKSKFSILVIANVQHVDQKTCMQGESARQIGCGLINLILVIFTARKVCKAYVFTCVCLSTRRSTWAGTPRAGTPPGKYPLGQVHPPAGTPPWAGTPGGQVPPQEGTPWEGTPITHTPPHTPPHTPGSSACWEIQATSGRYASYWNAFLLIQFVQSFRFR